MTNIKKSLSLFAALALIIQALFIALGSQLMLSAETANSYTVEYIETITNEELAALGSNLVAGKKAVPYTIDADGNRKSVLGNSSANDNLGEADARLLGLTDGSVSTINEMMTAYGQPIKPLCLEYVLDDSAVIGRFFMVGASNGTLNTSAYEVYLSESRDELYSAENCIYSYDHTKDGIHGGQIVTFDKSLRGSFLAVKITKPTIANWNQAGHHARIAEIAVYGKSAYDVDYVETVTNEDVATLGTSLIAGKKAAPYTDGEDGTLKSMLGNSSNKDNLGDAETRLTGLTDGSVDKINEMMTANGQPIKSLYLEYDLGISCSVEKFFMVGQNTKNLNTSAYEVYLGDSKDTLYDPENLIYTYDHTKNGIHGGQLVTFNTELEGSYLAVKITKPTIDNLDQAGHHARIYEIGVYGKATYSTEYVDTITNEEVAALGTSLIAGKKAVPYTDGENGMLKSMLGNSSNEENLGDADTRLAGLTDGHVDKINEMMTAYGQPIKPLYLEYDLGVSCTVEKFFMLGIANGSLNTSAYEVYLADNRDTLYTLSHDRDRFPLAEKTKLVAVEKGRHIQRMVFTVSPTLRYNQHDVSATCTVTLTEGLERIDFHVDAYWNTYSHRLRVAFPACFNGKGVYGIPYGQIQREEYEPIYGWAGRDGDYPAEHWGGVEGKGISVALLNAGTPSYKTEAVDGQEETDLFMSLLRSPTLPCFLHEPDYYSMTDWDGMRDAGNHSFDYALCVYDTTFADSSVVADASNFSAAPVQVSGVLSLPQLPLMKADNVAITSVKRSEDGNALILRLNEYRGRSGIAEITVPDWAETVEKTNLLERNGIMLPVQNGKVTVDIRPFEIATLKFDRR